MTHIERRHYEISHKSAKFIVYIINTILIVTIALVELSDLQLGILLAVTNASYYFGVNSVAHLIEIVFNLKSKHDNI